MRELTVIRPGPSSTTGRQRAKPRTAKGSNHNQRDVNDLTPFGHSALLCYYKGYIALAINHNHQPPRRVSLC